MFSIDLECALDAKDLFIADLWEAGSTGIVELDESDRIANLRVFFDDDALAPALQQRFGGDPTPADNRDWIAFAHEFLKPMTVGRKLFVIPQWRNDPTPDGRLRIEINAGLAFGTGAHETTRLCLEALEDLIFPGCDFADVGTGSGILAEAAYKLGAGSVAAIDNDPQAVVAANENFERAAVLIRATDGSAEAVASNSADVLAANISPAWIADLAPEWIRILRAGGVAVLSGFESQDVDAVSCALLEAGADIGRIREAGTWRAIEARARPQ